MIGKCSRCAYGTVLHVGGQSRQLSGQSRKSQSILSALSASRPKTPANNHPKKNSTKIPAKDPDAKSSLSFLSEVEKFLQNEREKSSTHSFHKNQCKDVVPPKSIEKSIFEVFKVPPPPKRSENAYDAEAYDAFAALLNGYFEMLESREGKTPISVMDEESRQSVKSWLLRDNPRMKESLPTLITLYKEGMVNLQNEPTRKSMKKQLQDDLREQEIAFLKELGWTEGQYKYATNLLHQLASLSLQRHEALPIVIVWEKLIEMGCLEKKTMDACLEIATSFSGSVLSRNRSSMLRNIPNNSLLDLFGDKNDTKRKSGGEADNPNKLADLNVPEQVAMANDLLYKPTNHSTSIIVRMLISLRDAANALSLIEARMKGETKRRAYSQVFNLRLELGDVTGSLFLMKKMTTRGAKSMPLQPEQFVQLIAVAAEKRYFCHGRGPDQSLLELGYEVSGPPLFDRLVAQMSSYVASISSASAKRLQRAFQRGFNDDVETKRGVDLNALSPLRHLKEAVPQTQLIADRVRVDTSTGYCVSSGARLRLIDLHSKEKRRLQQGLLDLGQKKGRQDKGRHVQALQSFWDWLARRKGPRFTAIVDGANVAYHMQNFDQGRFNFGQIDFVVAALEEKGLNPLVILPYKYTLNSFRVTLGTATKPQTATANDRLIMERLRNADRIYSVPQGCLDDYFWISATVANQGSQDDGKRTIKSDRQALGSDKHPIVITNDQIRDHKEFELLETKVFNRWYSNTIVNYSFTGFVGDECVDPEIAFNPADTFSREIQKNDCSDGQIAWHFPVSDWEISDWFCVRIPALDSSDD